MWSGRGVINTFSKVVLTGLTTLTTLTTQTMSANAQESSSTATADDSGAWLGGFSKQEVLAIATLSLMTVAGLGLGIRSQFNAKKEVKSDVAQQHEAKDNDGALPVSHYVQMSNRS